MDVELKVSSLISKTSIAITGSKSETNRLLLLQALYPGIKIINASESDDSAVMRLALGTNAHVIDVHHAGTAMRFLTAYFALQEDREVVLKGSQRMKERPVKVLVDALRNLGAEVSYVENEGYPPIKVQGNKLAGGRITIRADVSSQYISALLLIAPKLDNGLELVLEGEVTSMPYIKMTIGLLHQIGVQAKITDNIIVVAPLQNVNPITITVESDWSSASYYYSIVALAEPGTELTLSSYRQDSLQGDSALAEIYKLVGVITKFNGTTITLSKTEREPTNILLQLNDTPDIAQTIAVTCLGLGISCKLMGLHTLKIKETDRLAALKAELEKLGAQVTTTDETLILSATENLVSDVEIETYNDHRMAMAFAPLAVTGTSFVVKDAEVVSKSYPTFWEDLTRLGYLIVRR